MQVGRGGWEGASASRRLTRRARPLSPFSNLQELELQSKVNKGIYQDLVNQMAAIDQRKAPHLQDIATAQAALDAIKKDAERTQAELEKTATDSAKAENAIRRADADLANTQQKLADVAERLNTLRRELQVTTRCRSMGMAGLCKGGRGLGWTAGRVWEAVGRAGVGSEGGRSV